jgi:hypothetical protein
VDREEYLLNGAPVRRVESIDEARALLDSDDGVFQPTLMPALPYARIKDEEKLAAEWSRGVALFTKALREDDE